MSERIGRWRKSSRSTNNGSNCVEARLAGRLPQLSDSKLASARPILTLDESEYMGFIDAIKNGSRDLDRSAD